MNEGQDPTGVGSVSPADDFDNDVADVQSNTDQAATFQSKNIGSKATTEYFSNVKGGKKNREKVERHRSRINKKALTIILGIVAALLIVVMIVFVILNLTNRTGSRTHEELPTTMSEVQQRAYKKAYETGAYYDGVNYLVNLVQDLEDSGTNKEFVFEVKIFMLRFLSEAGDPDTAIDLLQGLESETLTDRQKYLLYSALVDIYNSVGNTEDAKSYQEKFSTLDMNNNQMNFTTQSGGWIDEE